MENKIPTAEEFLHQYRKRIGVRLISDMSPEQVSQYAIEFAKIQVEYATGTVKEDIFKCRCGNSSDELHTCPFAEEINGDSETLCNCCSECQYECAMDI